MIGALRALASGDHAAARRYLDTAQMLGMIRSQSVFETVRSEEAYARGALEEASLPMVALFTRLFKAANAEDVVRSVFDALGGKAPAAPASKIATELFSSEDRSGALCRNWDVAGVFVRWQVRLGALDAAFASARRIVENWQTTRRLPVGGIIPFWAPAMAPFRRDPRFQAIVRDLGLFAYWERHGPPDGYALDDGRLIERQGQGSGFID